MSTASLSGSASSAMPAAVRQATSPVLAVRDLHKAFGGVQAVQGLSLQVHAGEMLALIGPNGAGKSTSFNCINGQLRPDAGTVHLGGRDLTGHGPRALWRSGVGRTFQVASIWSSLTVIGNLQMALLAQAGRSLWPFGRAQSAHREAARDLLESVGLLGLADAPAGTLAYGDIKRLELAVALANSPRLLLMDEPTAGMAPGERHAMMTLVQQLARRRAMAVLFTEHSMDVVFSHADRIVVMAQGRVITQGTPDQVREDAGARAVYLGDSVPTAS
ncbi:MAG: ABC transporter ATP-binding protein [Burkholderiaceae bacterium]